MSKTDESLERLVFAGKCNCIDVKEYATQLRNLAKTEADPAEAKKRGKLYKALGDGTRQRILSLLYTREMCVCELIIALNMTQPTTSHHLRILEDVNLVQSRKEGKWVYYSVADPELTGRLIDIKM
jgi:DNA-binding transcriptional ArsR family regulator